MILLLHTGGNVYGEPAVTVVRYGACASMFYRADNQAPGTVAREGTEERGLGRGGDRDGGRDGRENTEGAGAARECTKSG